MGIGNAFTGGAQIAGGVLSRRAKDSEAVQYETSAGQASAVAQREAAEQERKAKLLESRALAVAGASGAGASDRTVVDIIAGIAQEGAYRSQLAIYSGEEQARALKAKADATRYEGKAAQAAGIVRGLTSMGKSGATLYEKYGKKKGSVLTSSNVGGDDPYFDEAGWGMT